jgi:hypothetical protein
MAKIDIVHDAHGNVFSFGVHSDSETHKTGVKASEGQVVTSLEIPGHPSEDPKAFTAAVHSHLRRHQQG